MPAAPTIGLTFFLLNRLRSFANITPAMESNTNATRPRPMMMSVFRFTNWSARMENEIVMPSSSVMRFASVFCAVSERRSRQPHSRRRLPNIRKPTSETDIGAMKPAMMVTRIGKQMRSVRETFLGL